MPSACVRVGVFSISSCCVQSLQDGVSTAAGQATWQKYQFFVVFNYFFKRSSLMCVFLKVYHVLSMCVRAQRQDNPFSAPRGSHLCLLSAIQRVKGPNSERKDSGLWPVHIYYHNPLSLWRFYYRRRLAMSTAPFTPM